MPSFPHLFLVVAVQKLFELFMIDRVELSPRFIAHSVCMYTVNHKKGGSTFVIRTLDNLIHFNNFYIYGNRNKYCR